MLVVWGSSTGLMPGVCRSPPVLKRKCKKKKEEEEEEESEICRKLTPTF
jgi:hypothetical protein